MTSDGLRTFDYDASNRMSKVKVYKDGEAASIRYLHNQMGQRVFKGEPTAEQTLPDETALGTSFIDWLKRNFSWLYATAQANTSIGTAYVYGGDNEIPAWALLGEYDNGSSKGAGRTEYIWMPTEDGSATPIGLYRGGQFYALHTDHLGTPRLMTNEANKPVWQWPYSAFGSNKPSGILKATVNPKAAITNRPVLLQATAAPEMNLGFPGQMRDVETGMVYNYFRHFDPKTGTYITMDPIGMDGGWNRRGYVGGNPLMLTDVWGLMEVFRADNGVSFHAYPGPPAGGNEHARAGAGENYHMHLRDRQGREVRMSTETWKPLTPEDERIFKNSPQMQKACESLTDGQKKFFDRVNRQVFHRGMPTDKQLMRLLDIRLGGRGGGGRGNE